VLRCCTRIAGGGARAREQILKLESERSDDCVDAAAGEAVKQDPPIYPTPTERLARRSS